MYVIFKIDRDTANALVESQNETIRYYWDNFTGCVYAEVVLAKIGFLPQPHNQSHDGHVICFKVIKASSLDRVKLRLNHWVVEEMQQQWTCAPLPARPLGV